MVKERYVYVVLGICHDYDGEAYAVYSDDYAVHSTLVKAQKELDTILEEILQEARDNGYTVTPNRGDTWLDVEYETGTIEKYQIYRSRIN